MNKIEIKRNGYSVNADIIIMINIDNEISNRILMLEYLVEYYD